METHWTISKWSMEQLDHKTVEFYFPAERGIAQGIGEFWVRQNPQGLLAIDIVVDLPKSPVERIQTRFHIPQVCVDAIERHENPTVTEFRLFCSDIPRTV